VTIYSSILIRHFINLFNDFYLVWGGGGVERLGRLPTGRLPGFWRGVEIGTFTGMGWWFVMIFDVVPLNALKRRLGISVTDLAKTAKGCISILMEGISIRIEIQPFAVLAKSVTLIPKRRFSALSGTTSKIITNHHPIPVNVPISTPLQKPGKRPVGKRPNLSTPPPPQTR
jgi:hypothetical protein